MDQRTYDAVVVGAGNAAYSAGNAAREHVDRICVLEQAPKEWHGGNSYFTAAGLGIDERALRENVDTFNAAVLAGDFNPAIRDGKAALDVTPPKNNWALPIDTPPFVGFPVTCGLTFIFGGVRIDEHARVLDRSNRPISGLHAAGEMVGGLFYHNYPGGSGLIGAVFGYRAGVSAARWVQERSTAGETRAQ